MLCPMDVLPTPGGPTMVMILPCVVPRNWPTAINSRILLLDILQAVVVGIEDICRLRDIQPFLEEWPHGMDVSHSR